MDYITITAPTYEDAVAKAKKEYGSRLRIHSRKTSAVKSGIFGLNKTTMCELTCFLTEDDQQTVKSEVDLASCEPVRAVENNSNKDEEIKRFENEARTPNPDSLRNDITQSDVEVNVASIKVFEQAKKNIEEELKKIEEAKVPGVVEKIEAKKESEESIVKLLDKVRDILLKNDFTFSYIDTISSSIKETLEEASPELPSDEELEIMVLDRIAESLTIDNNFGQNPERIVAVLGPSNSGKTSIVAKLAALFSSVNNTVRRNVRVVLLDDSPAVVAQLQKVGKALNISVSVAPHEKELADAMNAQLNNELVFVDAIGRPVQSNNPDYRIYGLMNVTNRSETKYILVLSAAMKNSDIHRVMEQHKSCSLSGLIVTKLDETTTVGNIISASFERKLPILYTSSGKRIPKDINKATSNALLRLLQGFSIDINKVIDSED